jgi:hypothetical protein
MESAPPANCEPGRRSVERVGSPPASIQWRDNQVVKDKTRDLWTKQNQHPGDRHHLFGTVAQWVSPAVVLYPGSFVDIAASFVFPNVVYVDSDRRAATFFSDTTGVDELVRENGRGSQTAQWEFLSADYTTDIGVEDESVDLLISLYAGFISEECTRYLKQGGHLLVNSSHGDAALASLDDRYRLAAAVRKHRNGYRTDATDLDTYLIPKTGHAPSRNAVLASGRGIAYTKPSAAYLFERIA